MSSALTLLFNWFHDLVFFVYVGLMTIHCLVIFPRVFPGFGHLPFLIISPMTCYQSKTVFLRVPMFLISSSTPVIRVNYIQQATIKPVLVKKTKKILLLL